MSNAPTDPFYAAIVVLPAGAAGVRTGAGRVTGLDLLPPGTGAQPPSDPLAARCAEQLLAYVADPTAGFDLPLALTGTPFQRRVWSRLGAIRVGQTRSYGALARELGSGARATAAACRANRLPLLLPCHRVVGRDGIGGYAGQRDGWRLAFKRWLLAHEGRI